MKKLILTFGILITLSGCGYDSYEECRLRETQKCGENNTACNSRATTYCKSEFPKLKPKKIKLEDNVDYTIKMVVGTVNVKNYSNSTIRVVKVVPKRCGEPKSVNWDEEKNYLAGRLIYSGQDKDVVTFTDVSDRRDVDWCFHSYVGT